MVRVISLRRGLSGFLAAVGCVGFGVMTGVLGLRACGLSSGYRTVQYDILILHDGENVSGKGCGVPRLKSGGCYLKDDEEWVCRLAENLIHERAKTQQSAAADAAAEP